MSTDFCDDVQEAENVYVGFAACATETLIGA